MMKYKVGGAITTQNKNAYVYRKADQTLIEALYLNEYVLLIEPRQHGKTSLINAMIRNKFLPMYEFVYIDTTTLDVSQTQAWYSAICTRLLQQIKFVESKLDLPVNHVGWRSFLSKLAIAYEDIEKTLVIVLDEIGAVSFEGATNFFSVLRDIYNSRQIESQFEYITFILSGVFNPRQLIDDDRISPFNIAQRIRLHDFDFTQTLQLVQLENQQDNLNNQIAEKIHYWSNGQPYLTQLMCVATKDIKSLIEIEDIIQNALRLDENHLPPLFSKLLADPNLMYYIQRILHGEQIKYYPINNSYQVKLELLGILVSNSQGVCVIRNPVYQMYLKLLSDFIEPQHQKDNFKFDQFAQSCNSKERLQKQSNLTVLFLAADPSDMVRLRINEELRSIQENLYRSVDFIPI